MRAIVVTDERRYEFVEAMDSLYVGEPVFAIPGRKKVSLTRLNDWANENDHVIRFLED